MAPCRICGAATRRVGPVRGDYSRRDYEVRRCDVCGFAFIADPWTDFERIYDDRYYAGQGADPLVDYHFELAEPDRTIRQYEWRGVTRLVERMLGGLDGVRWLDFGCGNGRPRPLCQRADGRSRLRIRGGIDRDRGPRAGHSDRVERRAGDAGGELRRGHGDRGDRAHDRSPGRASRDPEAPSKRGIAVSHHRQRGAVRLAPAALALHRSRRSTSRSSSPARSSTRSTSARSGPDPSRPGTASTRFSSSRC